MIDATVELGLLLVTEKVLLFQARPPLPVEDVRESAKSKQLPMELGADMATTGFTGLRGACTSRLVASAKFHVLQLLTIVATVH